jgi:hypothetical protein
VLPSGRGQQQKTRKNLRVFCWTGEKSGAFVAGEFFVFDPEKFFSFDVVGVLGDAIHRADLNALRLVIVTDAFGALAGVDFINLGTLRNGFVGTLRFANVAVDAFVGDD